MALTTGKVLQQRYRIVSLLGQGGMGAVYRAWHLGLNVAVALKEMVPQPGIDPAELAELRAQFKQEANVLARLSHPHLVRVTDFFEELGNAYLVMDFIEGESLLDRIDRRGALPEGEVLEWAGQLLGALGYCHSQGIIHRDVKPHNVIIRRDGRAVLVDFGLVKLWDPNNPHTKTAIRGMGTPEYAPPEQYSTQSGHTGPHSDVYGLGATLYHALAGQAPPTATDRIVDPENLVPIQAIAPGVSAGTATVVLWAMELRPVDRFQSVQEMMAALQGAVPAPARLPAQAGPAPPPPTKVLPAARPSAPPAAAPSPAPAVKGSPSPAGGRGLPAAKAGGGQGMGGASRDGKEMVHVPAGPFLYGEDKKKRNLPEFWIDRAPVTNAEYARFVLAAGYKPPKHWKGKTSPKEIADHPVVNVSWHDAMAYAEWAGKRLLTEEEWEKAARGTDGRVYPWGDELDNDKCNTRESGIGATMAVGRYSPQGDSPYGCVDMAGNVWEWTASDHERSGKVLRGGSWLNVSDVAHSAFRSEESPVDRYDCVGFRCVRSP